MDVKQKDAAALADIERLYEHLIWPVIIITGLQNNWALEYTEANLLRKH